MTNTSSQGDQRALQWLAIDDFSPGIYDNSVIVTGVAPNTVPGIFPAPPGAADATGTFRCIALANGGLGPGPAFGGQPGQNGLSLSSMGISVSGATDITALANSFQDLFDELVIGVTQVSGGSQTTHFYSYVVATSSLNSITTGTYNFVAGSKNYCCFPFTTTILASGNAQPVVVLPLTAPDGPTSALMVYPSVAAANTFSVDVIASQCGTAFGHQGRIVAIQPNNSYQWPIAPSQFPNEAFNYTDPAQSETWPHQFETFGPESPFGYGAMTSVSAGELFCVKKRQGAIIIQGDLNNPTVTSLPAVRSSGITYGRADSDPTGTYYCSQQQGAWVWNGGNASTKVSTQLDDNFYVCANEISDTTYYGYYCQRWGDWMLFSNNWLRDARGAWWRLSDPSANSGYRSHFWYIPGYEERFMFGASQTVANGSTDFLYEYDRSIPASSYTWKSLPLRLGLPDRFNNIREVVIRASNPYGDPNPQIAVSLIDSSENTTALDSWTMTPGINTVQSTQLKSALRSKTIAVALSCTGTNYAPVVHSINLGYRVREQIPIS